MRSNPVCARKIEEQKMFTTPTRQRCSCKFENCFCCACTAVWYCAGATRAYFHACASGYLPKSELHLARCGSGEIGRVRRYPYRYVCGNSVQKSLRLDSTVPEIQTDIPHIRAYSGLLMEHRHCWRDVACAIARYSCHMLDFCGGFASIYVI